MAGEYTAGAYAGVQPIQEDFGDIALKGYEMEMQLNAQNLALRKQKAAEAAESQKRLADNFKDFDELSSKALNVHAKNFDQEVVGQMVAGVKERLADYARRLSDLMTSAREVAMIKTNMRRLSDNALNFTTGQKRFQEFLDSMKNVDVDNGWDSVLSGSSILAVSKAIVSAGEKGMSDNGDGTYNVGDHMKFKLDDDGNPVIMTLNDKGDWITGTIDETINRWRMQMTPYVDLHKNLWDYAGKGIQSRAREFYRSTPGGLIEVIKRNDWAEIDRMIGEDFDTRFPDSKDFKSLPPSVRKAITSGEEAGWNNREDIRNEYIRTGRNKVKDDASIQLRNDPSFLNEYQQFRINQTENTNVASDFLELVQGAAAGSEDFKKNFIGKSIDLNIPGMKGGDVKVEDIWREGNKLKIEARGGFVNEQGESKSAKEIYEFNMENPESIRTLLNKLSVPYNQGKGEKQKVSAASLKDFYNQNAPMFEMSDEEKRYNAETENILSDIDRSLSGKKRLKTSELETVLDKISKQLKEQGYNTDISGSWLGFLGNMQVEIYDRNKDGVVSIDEVSGDELAKELRKAIYTNIINPSKAKQNPDWIKRSYSASPLKSVTQTSSKTQRGNAPKF